MRDTNIKFFDLNPLGRILNRFSSDTHMMDEVLPQLGVKLEDRGKGNVYIIN